MTQSQSIYLREYSGNSAHEAYKGIVVDTERNEFKVITGMFRDKKEFYEKLAKKGYVVRKVFEKSVFDWIEDHAKDTLEAYLMFSTAFSKWRNNNVLQDYYVQLLNDLPQYNRKTGTKKESTSDELLEAGPVSKYSTVNIRPMVYNDDTDRYEYKYDDAGEIVEYENFGPMHLFTMAPEVTDPRDFVKSKRYDDVLFWHKLANSLKYDYIDQEKLTDDVFEIRPRGGDEIRVNTDMIMAMDNKLQNPHYTPGPQGYNNHTAAIVKGAEKDPENTAFRDTTHAIARAADAIKGRPVDISDTRELRLMNTIMALDSEVSDTAHRDTILNYNSTYPTTNEMLLRVLATQINAGGSENTEALKAQFNDTVRAIRSEIERLGGATNLNQHITYLQDQTGKNLTQRDSFPLGALLDVANKKIYDLNTLPKDQDYNNTLASLKQDIDNKKAPIDNANEKIMDDTIDQMMTMEYNYAENPDKSDKIYSVKTGYDKEQATADVLAEPLPTDSKEEKLVSDYAQLTNETLPLTYNSLKMVVDHKLSALNNIDKEDIEEIYGDKEAFSKVLKQAKSDAKWVNNVILKRKIEKAMESNRSVKIKKEAIPLAPTPYPSAQTDTGANFIYTGSSSGIMPQQGLVVPMGGTFHFREDSTHTELNPLLFDGDVLKPEIRSRMLVIAKDFEKTLHLAHTPIDIYFTGSCANYTYHEQSDIDLHIVYDYSKIDIEPEFLTSYFIAKKQAYNRDHEITIKGLPVEVGVEDINQPIQSTAVYSLTKDAWVMKPVHSGVEFGDIDFKLYDELTQSIEDAIGSSDFEKIGDLWTRLYDIRKASLASEGELGSGNQLFKELRNRGFLDRLKTAYYACESESLSLETLKETK